MICQSHHSHEAFKRAAGIKAVLLDVDGVLTDGAIAYDSGHQELKLFNALDGQGIRMAQMAGLITGIISARDSEPIRIRATELGIKYVYLGRFDKINAFAEVLKESGLQETEVCFIGDDLPDITVLNRCGLPIAVQNASSPVKDAALLHTRRHGGRGAVRESIEFILNAQDQLEYVLEKFRQGPVTF